MAFVKRVLVGRPLATTEQEHQRIPKTIALAVFSSDAISSTAYATEEILFVTAVGASSLALGLEHARPDRDRGRGPARDRRHVVPPDDLRLPERRRLATSSAARTSARYPSLVAGASLLVDYILTVAVSISAGVAAIISIPQFQGLAEHRVALGLVLIVAHHARRTCAASRSRAASSRSPPTSTSWSSARSSCYGLFRSFVLGDIGHVPFDPKPFEGSATTSRRHARHLPAAEGLLVGRGRAHRRRGDLQRRARVPPAGVEERGDDARVDGRDPRHAVLRRLGPRAPPRSPYPSHDADGDRADGPGRCSATAPLFVRPAVRDRRRSSRSPPTPRTPTSRGCRRSSPSDGYLPAPARQPRRPARVLERHRRPRRSRPALLIVAFGGITNALIPLYAVGVFTSFTLSQSGMVRHHQKEQRAGLASATS